MKDKSDEHDQLPPHSIEDEQGVLGCCLLQPALVPKVWDKLRHDEKAFYDRRHRIIFSALAEMHKKGVGIDLITVNNWLRERRKAKAVGGLDYITALNDKTPSAHNLDYYLNVVCDLFTRRRLSADISKFATQVLDPSIQIETLIKAHLTTAEYLSRTNGPANRLTIRTPDEIRSMKFDDSDRIIGDRIIAKGQNATLCGPSSVGKTRLALQMAAASITGREFVTLETRGENLKWLFVQAENSNRRLQFDFEKLGAWIGERDWPRVNDRVKIHTLETDTDGFLNLDDEANRSAIHELIQDTKPDVVVFDSLYNFQIGDLNKDVDMAATLAAISRLTKTGNPERVPLALHHALTGKAGAAKATGYDRGSFGRNSKVLHAWTRGQINVAAGSPDNNDLLVLSCGKCSNGREFGPFAVRLNPKTFIYESDHTFDVSAWQTDMNGTPSEPLMNPDRVRELCAVSGSGKTELAKAIMEDCGCSRATAFRHAARAEKAKKITWSKAHEQYFRK